MLFTKVHGLGNDFVLVEAFDGLPSTDLARLAQNICDRHTGVGADGLVFLQSSPVADVRMRIYNADGSEAEMCGNALRCVGRYMYERGFSRWPDIAVETLAGIKQVHLHLEGGKFKQATVDMGAPVLDPVRIPILSIQCPPVLVPIQVADRTYRVTAVSMGNPHAVVFVPELSRVDLAKEGPALERHLAFPRGTNVEFVQVLNPGRVMVRVWERGVGATLACGTGACAVGVACVLNGLTEDKLTVDLPGGSLIIHWRNQQRVFMTGPAEEVFRGEWALEK